jgi:uncharacterized protein (DUF58 family)
MTRAAVVALMGVALTLVAFLFDASPLFVPGVAFTVLGIATPAWIWLSAAGASIERRIHADRVMEDEPLEATIEVRRGPLGLPGAQVLDPLAREPVSLRAALSSLAGAPTAQLRVIARFPRRGRIQLAHPFLVLHDTLALATVRRSSSVAAQELLVLPRIEPVRWAQRSGAEHGERSATAAPSDPLLAVELDGLRPYRQGTPASRIHWPAVARGAGLLERRLRADRDTRPLVVLDARGDGPEEHLDAAVRAAASLAIELARRGGCGLLLPGERRPITLEPDLGAWPGAHARLALIEGGPGASAPLLGRGAGHGPVFYVSAQPLEALPALAFGMGRRAGVLVIPTGHGARPSVLPSFEVAGCHGFVVGARGRARVAEAV